MTEAAGLDVDQVRDAVRAFARDNDGLSRVRAEAADRGAGLPPDSDRTTWRRLCDELGVSALVVPEQLDGLGAGETAVAVVLEELGYRLEPAPVWSCLNATRALCAGAEPSDQLSGMLSGELLGTVARPAGPPTARPDVRLDGRSRLDGVARFVPDAVHADVLIVVADDGSGPVLALVDDVHAWREECRPRRGSDLVRTVADIDLTGVAARPLVTDPDQVRRLVDVADVAMAAELLGGARACLDRTVEYLSVREQFGRMIGTFQALQHACAGLAVRIEQTRAVVEVALRAVDRGDDLTRTRVAPLARALAAETFAHGADVLVHLHGGIGFTWEHDAHLFFRRASAAAAWGGTPSAHFAEAARRGAASILTPA